MISHPLNIKSMERKRAETSSALWRFVIPVILLAIGIVELDASPCLFLFDLILPSTGRFEASYKDNSIWVTGASAGIGAEIVCQLVEAEAGRIVLSARRVDKLKQVARDCVARFDKNGDKSSSTTISIVPYDATDVDTAGMIVDKALEGGPIDVVILNAGIYQSQKALETSPDEARRIMRINYEAPVELFNALVIADAWKQRGYGQVLAVSSIAAHLKTALASTYVASKSALGAYFHTVYAEESSWLRVSVACPGPVVSDVWKAAGVKTSKASELSKMPVHRAVQLMLTGSIGPSFLFYETWIGSFLFQIALWFNSQFPTFFQTINHSLARVRVSQWERNGVDEFALSAFIYGLIERAASWIA